MRPVRRNKSGDREAWTVARAGAIFWPVASDQHVRRRVRHHGGNAKQQVVGEDDDHRCRSGKASTRVVVPYAAVAWRPAMELGLWDWKLDVRVAPKPHRSGHAVAVGVDVTGDQVGDQDRAEGAGADRRDVGWPPPEPGGRLGPHSRSAGSGRVCGPGLRGGGRHVRDRARRRGADIVPVDAGAAARPPAVGGTSISLRRPWLWAPPQVRWRCCVRWWCPFLLRDVDIFLR